MIEYDHFPLILRVARLAFLSVRSFVFVVFLVTGITICRCVFKSGRQVAFRTFHLGVLPHQREARLVMVERRLLP